MKTSNDPEPSKEDEQSFAESTIRSAEGFLKDVDDDIILDDLVVCDNEAVSWIEQVGCREDFEDLDTTHVPVGTVEPKFGASESLMGLTMGTPVNAFGDPSLDAMVPTETLSPTGAYESFGDCSWIPLQAAARRSDSRPRNIGYEGAKSPKGRFTNKKRGQYRERRESWTTTQGTLRDRLSGTISTKTKSNPLPQFQEKILTVSAKEAEGDYKKETKEAEDLKL